MSDIGVLFGVTVQDVDLAAWERAWETWLGKRSDNTQRAYKTAWEDLGAFSGLSPWEITASELEAWLVDMRARDLKPATIRQRIGAVSSFFSYVSEKYLVPGPGGQVPLIGYNPAKAVDFPRVDQYHQAVYLDVNQVRALLRVIPRDTAQGLRDYALILFYVATGRRSSEIRKLRWGDFRPGDPVKYHWTGKGKTRWDDCPAEVWEAVKRFLAAVDRLASMKPASFVFTALGDQAGRFPHISGDDYDPTQRPLSGPEVVRILRKYAQAAGIQADGLRVHSLRHTTAMLLRAVGQDTKTIQDQLGHSNIQTTDHYIHSLARGQNAGWAQVRDYLGL